MSLDGIDGRVIDMTVELTNVEGREFKVDVAHNEEYTTTFTYYPEKHEVCYPYEGYRQQWDPFLL